MIPRGRSQTVHPAGFSVYACGVRPAAQKEGPGPRPAPPVLGGRSGVEYCVELLETLDLAAVALVELGVDLGTVHLAGHVGLLGAADLHGARHVAGVEGERLLAGLLDLGTGGLGVGVVPAFRAARERVRALLEALGGIQGVVSAQGTFDGQLDLGVT